VVVDVERVGEGAQEPALALDELHVPAAPDHVVQPAAKSQSLSGGVTKLVEFVRKLYQQPYPYFGLSSTENTLYLTKYGSGYVVGDFSHKTSGHPALRTDARFSM
jgi:hypothetical protein